MAAFGSSAMNGSSVPNASECMTVRRYGWHPAARRSSNRARIWWIAAPRFSSSAAFMLM
jgi:hypothetical protein